MICEYTIRITGDHNILVLSPQIIGTLLEKIRYSETRELIIPAEELLPQGYTEYLENAAQFNIETNRDFFLLTKQSDSRFLCDYGNGEKIMVSLKYL